jgi:uncharacterized protein YbjT (DUF2867 family)
MKLLVLGASGGTGRQLASQALESGHEVVALTRAGSGLGARPGLRIEHGLASDPAALERSMRGCDAVLCALGGRPWKRTERVCSTALAQLLPLMTKQGISRIVAISTFGAGDSRPQVPLLARKLVFGLILRSEVADKEAMERLLEVSSSQWTAVRVGLLTDDPATGRWRASDDGSIRAMGKVPRADVAKFMLDQLASDAWLRRKPVLMS